MKYNNKRSLFSRPRTGEGFFSPHLGTTSGRRWVTSCLHSLTDWGMLTLKTWCLPSLPVLTLSGDHNWFDNGGQTFGCLKTKLTFTQVCWVWLFKWRLLGFFLLLIQQFWGVSRGALFSSFCYKFPFWEEEVKGRGQTPHTEGVGSSKYLQVCDWYRLWQETNKVLWEK